MSLERWDWTERRHVAKFRGRGFATCDPGQSGCLLAFRPGSDLPIRAESPLHPRLCAQALEKAEAEVLIVETQYVTNPKMARSVIELTLSMGVMLGWVLKTRHEVGQDLNLLEVAPSSWQAWQRKAHCPDVAKTKGIGLQIAMKVAEDQLAATTTFWRPADEKFRTGIASAWGIAGWWRSIAS